MLYRQPGMERGWSPVEREQARQVRRAALDVAWPLLKAAIPLWRPVSDCHIAPVVLFTEPPLAEMITPDRGRELLRITRR